MKFRGCRVAYINDRSVWSLNSGPSSLGSRVVLSRGCSLRTSWYSKIPISIRKIIDKWIPVDAYDSLSFYVPWAMGHVFTFPSYLRWSHMFSMRTWYPHILKQVTPQKKMWLFSILPISRGKDKSTVFSQTHVYQVDYIILHISHYIHWYPTFPGLI